MRLSALDADAAAALRVIAHFEALLGGGAHPVALVRSTAGLAECAAGWTTADGRTLRFGPDGRALPGTPEHISGTVDLGTCGRIWLERAGAAGPFDELVLEWMGITARVLAGSRPPTRPPDVADPALVELVLSEREAAEDRVRALRLLGLTPERRLHAVAVDGGRTGDPGVAAVGLLSRSGLQGVVRIAPIGGLGAVLVQRRDGDDSPAAELRAAAEERSRELPSARAPARGVRAGVGRGADPLAARASWAQARSALRFAVAGVPGESVADHDELGPVALLAEIPRERLREQSDVQALDRLAGRDGGESVLAALAAFCRTGSLRQSAARLHLHHSSVAARLARVEDLLGWRLQDPQDRFRAQLALYARRLAAPGRGG